MKTPNWDLARKQIVEALESLMPNWAIKEINDTISIKKFPPKNEKDLERGLKLQAGNHYFDIQWKSTNSAAAILHAIHHLKTFQSAYIPVVAVPFMGPTGKKLCDQEKINWIDLSGNAYINAHGLLISSKGERNKFISNGRASSVFAPKSSRIVRWLIQNPKNCFTNKQLLHETGVDASHANRILKHLEETAHILRQDSNEYRILNRRLLLEDWRIAYNFFKQNEVIKGHIPASTSEELLQKLSSAFHEFELQHAATGLAAAWLYTKFVSFRLVSMYVEMKPFGHLLNYLKFREEPRGANLWLAVPRDEGIFMGVENIDNIPCVSKIQTYIDLKDQPERSKEAAEELFRDLKLDFKNG